MVCSEPWQLSILIFSEWWDLPSVHLKFSPRCACPWHLFIFYAGNISENLKRRHGCIPFPTILQNNWEKKKSDICCMQKSWDTTNFFPPAWISKLDSLSPLIGNPSSISFLIFQGWELPLWGVRLLRTQAHPTRGWGPEVIGVNSRKVEPGCWQREGDNIHLFPPLALKAEPIHSQAEHIANRSLTFAPGILAGGGGGGGYLKDKTTGEEQKKMKPRWCGAVGGMLATQTLRTPTSDSAQPVCVCTHASTHVYTDTITHFPSLYA